MRIAILAALMTASMSVAAGSSAFDVKIGPRGETITIYPITEMVAKPGEEREVFLRRAGNLMSNYTQATGYETCSSICVSPDGGVGISLVTANSNLACPITDMCPEGMTALKETIHSHPHGRGNFRLNKVDQIFLSLRSAGRVERTTFRAAPSHNFSETDYAGGAGYLVAGRDVYFQNGHGTERLVGAVIGEANAPSKGK